MYIYLTCIEKCQVFIIYILIMPVRLISTSNFSF